MQERLDGGIPAMMVAIYLKSTRIT